jgi:ribonuclease HI
MIYNVYTDGSYIDHAKFGAFYSSAASIEIKGQPETLTTLTKVGNDSDLISMRNVAGEIMAVMMVLEHCLNVLQLTQEDTVNLHYDYVGIENWCKKKGEKDYWRSKTQFTQAYRDYMNLIVRPRFNVAFFHTPGHTGVPGNERVDKLARDAVKQHIRNLTMETR